LADIRHLERAVALAQENVTTHGGGPFGALVARDGAILAEGRNLVTASSDPTAHAEVVAIRAACQNLGSFELRGCELYTSCEPCPMCMAAAYWARLDRVYFAASREDAAAAGFDDQFLYEELVKPLGQRRLRIERLDVTAPCAPFEAWNRDQSKIRY
jgi:guanine deaminase